MANTYTPLLGLAKPAKGDTDWDDEITGNAGIIDIALGTEHRTDGAHGNTVRIGDGNNTEDKKIIARTGATNQPFIMYDVSDGRFVLSNDGTGIAPVMTGASKVLEVSPSGKPYVSIQQAINDASSGDLIIIYPGDYTLTNELNISKSVTLLGLGMPAVQYNPGSGEHVATVSAPAKLRGLRFVMTGSSGWGVIEIDSTGVVIGECAILNEGVSGCGLRCFSGGVIVKDCEIGTTFGTGIIIEEGTHEFRRCAVTAGGAGILVKDNESMTVTVADCEVTGGGSQPAIHLEDEYSAHVLICRRAMLKKGAGATYTVTETDSGSTGRIYQCALNADIAITNAVTSPGNVVDANV